MFTAVVILYIPYVIHSDVCVTTVALCQCSGEWHWDKDTRKSAEGHNLWTEG